MSGIFYRISDYRLAGDAQRPMFDSFGTADGRLRRTR